MCSAEVWLQRFFGLSVSGIAHPLYKEKQCWLLMNVFHVLCCHVCCIKVCWCVMLPNHYASSHYAENGICQSVMQFC